MIRKLKSCHESPEWDGDIDQACFSPKVEADEKDFLDDVKGDIKDESIQISFLKLKEGSQKFTITKIIYYPPSPMLHVPCQMSCSLARDNLKHISTARGYQTTLQSIQPGS